MTFEQFERARNLYYNIDSVRDLLEKVNAGLEICVHPKRDYSFFQATINDILSEDDKMAIASHENSIREIIKNAVEEHHLRLKEEFDKI